MLGEYGIRVRFPCITVMTRWGPIQIGGRCGEEARRAEEIITAHPEPSPFSRLFPYILLAGAGVAAVVILAKKKK